MTKRKQQRPVMTTNFDEMIKHTYLITDFDDLCEVIGGVGAVGKLCKQKSSAVGNWRRRKPKPHIPSKYFFVIQNELAFVNCVASLHLFNFEQPHRMSKLHEATLRKQVEQFVKKSRR